MRFKITPKFSLTTSKPLQHAGFAVRVRPIRVPDHPIILALRMAASATTSWRAVNNAICMLLEVIYQSTQRSERAIQPDWGSGLGKNRNLL